jgi:hypothetical protein
MRRDTVRLTLAVGLVFVALNAWVRVDQRKPSPDDFPADVASVWLATLGNVLA